MAAFVVGRILKLASDFVPFVATLLMAVSLSGFPQLFAILSFIVLPIGMMISALTSSQEANRLDASTNIMLKFLSRMFLYSALTSTVIFVAILITPSSTLNWIGNSNERWILFLFCSYYAVSSCGFPLRPDITSRAYTC